MVKLESNTIWLMICWRLAPRMIGFLDQNVYSSSGLYHPYGQNILRSSLFHYFKLFRPVVILVVAGGRSTKQISSTSKANDMQLLALARYLRLYDMQAALQA
jgi:hypothetical protein